MDHREIQALQEGKLLLTHMVVMQDMGELSVKIPLRLIVRLPTAKICCKNIVAAGRRKCEVQLAYAIGVAKPVSIMVDTFGTGIISDEKIVELIMRNFDLRPGNY